MCHGHKNGKPLDSGTSREHSGRKAKSSKKRLATSRTKERRYLRCVAKETAEDPERQEGKRWKKFKNNKNGKSFPSQMELSMRAVGD